jgi:hypothetical protein
VVAVQKASSDYSDPGDKPDMVNAGASRTLRRRARRGCATKVAALLEDAVTRRPSAAEFGYVLDPAVGSSSCGTQTPRT